MGVWEFSIGPGPKAKGMSPMGDGHVNFRNIYTLVGMGKAMGKLRLKPMRFVHRYPGLKTRAIHSYSWFG
jgi:hypothetical protein